MGAKSPELASRNLVRRCQTSRQESVHAGTGAFDAGQAGWTHSPEDVSSGRPSSHGGCHRSSEVEADRSEAGKGGGGTARTAGLAEANETSVAQIGRASC